MVPHKQIEDFVNRLRNAAGQDLESVILYGSAAAGDYIPETSNLNLLCVLRETSFHALTPLAPAVEAWVRQKHPAPLVMTRQELERSADVFSIELLDMQRHHRVLFGDDVLSAIHVPMHLHRAQVEYELREKLILFRQRLLLSASKPSRLWDLLLSSLSAFTTLFRHALIALGDATPRSKREAVLALSTRMSFDLSAFLQLLDVKENKTGRKPFDIADLCSRYLAAVEHVTAAVDTMFDSTGEKTS